MPIPELERARVEAELRRFADRVPAHVRPKLWYEFKFRGDTVALIECRPAFRNPKETTRIPFARFDFNAKRTLWSLKCADRNGRWHAYDLINPTRHFAELVAEVERDPTHIFLG